MNIHKSTLTGFEQIVEMLKSKYKDNKSDYINFTDKDVRTSLGSRALSILLSIPSTKEFNDEHNKLFGKK